MGISDNWKIEDGGGRADEETTRTLDRWRRGGALSRVYPNREKLREKKERSRRIGKQRRDLVETWCWVRNSNV